MDICIFNALKSVLGGDDSVEPSVLMSSTPIFERDDISPSLQQLYLSVPDEATTTAATEIVQDTDNIQTSENIQDTESSSFVREIPSSPESLPDMDAHESLPANTSGGDATETSQTAAENGTSITGIKKKRKQISQPINDQRCLMNLVQVQSDAMIRKLDEIQEERRAARRQRVKERQENRDFQERERERDRELLRELFGRRD
ncbi:hypothetical protein PF004_g3901 [Phytophthora fragariae]|uniref:Uncharacterized protein n=1 Tax=Phytophthora fragariae TaxID=53985 RepID=A0A6G0PKJ2_9STRA|nr:hypothetical protein PF004_g3901 [Phytophthora fragariae]